MYLILGLVFFGVVGGDKRLNKVKYNLEVVYTVSNWEGIIEYIGGLIQLRGGCCSALSPGHIPNSLSTPCDVLKIESLLA
jgi:hypothetical protein